MRIRLGLLIAMLMIVGGLAYAKHRHEAYLQTFLSPLENKEALRANKPPPPENDPMGALLAREIVRQGWLMAARDGLGLPTRDSMLREPTLQNVPLPTLELDERRLSCGLSIAPNSPIKGDWKLVIDSTKWDGYQNTAQAVEEFARGTFADAMHTMGLKGASKPAATTEPVLTDALTLLNKMNMCSQFAAVRQAHQSIAEHGASLTALSVLARGYANLGQLTRCLWDTDAQIFAARSMLYSQRMLTMAVKSDDHAKRIALWNRAYAQAMAGLQGDALDDLATAAKLAGDAPPDWVTCIDAYCRFQTAKLTDLTTSAAKGEEQLPAFLAFLTITVTNSPSAINQFGRAVLQDEPDNLRVVAALSAISGVSANHALTQYALVSTGKAWSEQLARMPGIPATVQAAAKEAGGAQMSPEKIAALADALVAAGAADRGEPSWAALGRMFQDANFLNVYQRIFFEARLWNIDASPSATALHPLIAGHPYAGYLHYLAPRAQGYGSEIPAGRIKVVDPQPKMVRMLEDLDRAGSKPDDSRFESWAWMMMDDLDITAFDAEVNYFSQDPNHQRQAVELLPKICPTHPIVAAGRIQTDWPAGEAAAVQAVGDGGSPLIAGELGKKYSTLKDWPKAEKYLRLYLKICPDPWAYWQLADNYLHQGDEANWLKTMQESLDQEDYALDHAQTNVKIAKHFMNKGQYDKAEPFANAAAESWAAWAMEVAEDCEEHLGHWGTAETWVKNETQRYGPAGRWLDWCQRTGHGDKTAAARAAGRAQ